MKRSRTILVVLLTLLMPFVASAGVRMQIAMRAAQMPASAAVSTAATQVRESAAISHDGCDQAGNEDPSPGKSMPCCSDRSGEECKLCSLPAFLAQNPVLPSHRSPPQTVFPPPKLAAYPDDASGLWRPPRA